MSKIRPTDTPEQRRARREKTQLFIADTEALELLVERIAGGEHLRAICDEHEITYSTTQVYLAQHMPAAYDAAKRVRADSAIDDLEALELELHEGDIGFNDFRELANSMKWRAEKLNPKSYGQHQNVDMQVTDVTKLHLDAIRMLTRVVVVPPPALTQVGTALALHPKDIHGMIQGQSIDASYVSLTDHPKDASAVDKDVSKDVTKDEEKDADKDATKDVPEDVTKDVTQDEKKDL